MKKFWPFIILAILSFLIHLAFLSYPSQVVFDEVHFGKFVAAYFTREYYFDIHPPLGKLLIAGWAKLNGANPVFAFEKIGEQISTQILFVLRFLPAFFGGLFVLAFAWLAYLISRSKTTALIAGFLILLDNAFLVQSKFILVDIFMLFFEALTLCFFLLLQRQKNFSLKWFFYLALTGLFFGLTIGVKWTGLAVLGMIGVILLAKIFSRKFADYLSGKNSKPAFPLSVSKKQSPPRIAVSLTDGPAKRKKRQLVETLLSLVAITAVGLAVYAAPFALHFRLLPHSGPGDAFMSWAFQQELKYDRDVLETPLSFRQKFWELNKTMFTANAGLKTEHPFGSRWFSWPFNYKPIYYWNQNQPVLPPNQTANIYFLGNSFLWGLIVLAILTTGFMSFSRRGRAFLGPAPFLLTAGYLLNLLPFILVKRVSFLYHYLPSAALGIILLALYLAWLWPKHKKIAGLIFAVVALNFILFAPVAYGWSMPARLFQIQIYLINFWGP